MLYELNLRGIKKVGNERRLPVRSKLADYLSVEEPKLFSFFKIVGFD